MVIVMSTSRKGRPSIFELKHRRKAPSHLQDPCEVRALPVKVQLQELRIKQMPLERKSALITVRPFTKNNYDREIV